MFLESPKLTLFFLIILGTIFGFAQKAKAAPIVISENTTWNKDEVKVIDSTSGQYGLTILPGATLTINPGTIIKMNYNATIYVRGKLDIKGNENNPVIITSIKNDQAGGDTNGDATTTAPRSGDWNAIIVASWGMTNIDYAEVSYAGLNGRTFLVSNNGTFNITHSNLIHDTGTIELSPYSNFKMNYSNIYPDTRFWRNIFGVITYVYPSISNTGYKTFDVSNNYWGNENGPTITPITKAEDLKGIFLYGPPGTFTYQPYLTTSWKPEKKTPVIIVPGIISSYLNKNSVESSEVWPNIDEMIVSHNDEYLNELMLPTSGELSDLEIIPSDIIREIRVGVIEKDLFKGLIAELKNKGYQENRDLFVFPYDWRLNISSVAGNDSSISTSTLAGFIKIVKNTTGAEKVDVIAHSMGGLVVKKYIYNSTDNSIDKFIDIATPHYGAPKAFKILQYGDDMGIYKLGLGLNQERVKIISQNFPSVYQLLPSKNYFEPGNYYYDHYIYDVQSIDPAKNYDQSIDFLKLSGRNWSLLDKAQNIHDEIDNLNINNAYNIVGCSVPTIGLIRIQDKFSSNEKDYDIKYFNGDGTVPLRSALGINAANTYYARGAEHAYISSTGGVKELISSILNNDINNFAFNEYNNLSQGSNGCIFSGAQVSFHSPIELHVYDENNNHVGPNENGDIEINISGAQYDVIGDNKFAFLPDGREYRIVGKATGLGEFSARIKKIENGNYKDETYFSDVPINNINTIVQYGVSDAQNISGITIKKDSDGNGIFEEEIMPSAVLNETESGDIDPPTTDIEITGELTEDGIGYYSPVTIGFTATDTLSGLLKIEYAINGTSTWEVYNNNDKPTIQKSGEYTIYYFSTDRAGIRESLKTKTITIVEKDCLDSLIDTINDLYNQGQVKNSAAKNLLLLKLDIIEKMLDKFEVRNSRICSKLKSCEKLNNKIDKLTNLVIEINLRFIQDQLELYQRQKWITKEAHDIILGKIQCIYNYLN